MRTEAAAIRESWSALEESVVKELANVGIGHATTALASMTGRAFHMSVPHLDTVELEEVPRLLQADETLSVGITMPITGDAEGHIMFLTTWPGAASLCRFLIGTEPAHPGEIGEMEASALMELGNIINSSFLNALSDMTGLRMEASPPRMACDMAASILQAVIVEASIEDHVALAVRTEIQEENGVIGGYFLYIPTLDGLNLAFRRLGILEAA